MKVSLYDIAGDSSTRSTGWNSEEFNDPYLLSVDFKNHIDLLCFFKTARKKKNHNTFAVSWDTYFYTQLEAKHIVMRISKHLLILEKA